MWQPNLEVTKTGPLTYRFAILESVPHEKTEYIVQDVDPFEHPVLQKTVGLPSLDYTFPGPGQYRVTVKAWRPRPDAPDFPEFGQAGRIIKVTDPTPALPPDLDPVPEPPPADDANTDTARPPVTAEEGDQYLSLGVRVVEWLLGREPTVVTAFVAGLAIGAGAAYLLLLG